MGVPSNDPPKPSTLASLPTAIWAMGFGSLFMDSSSELVHSLLPVFMTTVLGASMVTVGIIEGVAEATASITKVFSGMLSDYLGKRKFLMIFGYSLAALTKPVFPLATSIGWVFGARFVDRIGKGIRGAPRDALIADVTPAPLRGAAYGLRQSLDSVGAFIGPLLALLFMALFNENIHAVLWVAVLPAFLAVLVLGIYVKEPEDPATGSKVKTPIKMADARRLQSQYWLVVILGTVFTLARFSDAFLILRAENVGLSIGLVPMIMIVMNIVYSLLAYPAGVAADRFSRRTLLIAGLGLLILADLVLGFAKTPLEVYAGAAIWGGHMAMTQGLLSKLVADTAPEDLRGTAFGIFNLLSGIALLVASVLAGELWSHFGPAATFLGGAAFAGIAAVGLLGYRSRA